MKMLRTKAERKIASTRPGKMPGNLESFSPADAQRLLQELRVHQIELEMQNEELRQTQTDLEASRARYFDLYDLAPVGYFTLDAGGRIIEANLTGATLLGIARGALVKQHFSRYVVREDADTYYLHREQLLKQGTPQAFELRLARENGAPFSAWIEATAAPEGGGAPMWRIVVSDITVRKRAEQAQASLEAQLRESQKMEALGTLAGGIAHDFNNVLGTILGNAELARQDAARNHQALISLEEIQKAGHRARDLVQQILAFSRRQPTARRVISLRTVLEESVRLLRASLNGRVRLDCRCDGDAPAIVADPTQVQQVLLNLGTNADYAMEGQSGSIDFRCEAITLDERSARFDLNLRPGRYARIVVSDTGRGMDAETQRRIFEPFFTTKPVGKGTGLGLSVAHGIMQAHDGAIMVHSDPGQGCRFELYFPCAQTAALALSTSEKAEAVSEGDGRHVVIIDDDEAQLFLIKRMLERWGYRVSAYIEQREALDALRAGADRFDLVVTDYNMPGVSGIAVARAIRKVLPDLPLIVLSGYITDAIRKQAAEAGVNELISKPHEVEDLRDAVQRLLSPPSETMGRDRA